MQLAHRQKLDVPRVNLSRLLIDISTTQHSKLRSAASSVRMIYSFKGAIDKPACFRTARDRADQSRAPPPISFTCMS